MARLPNPWRGACGYVLKDQSATCLQSELTFVLQSNPLGLLPSGWPRGASDGRPLSSGWYGEGVCQRASQSSTLLSMRIAPDFRENARRSSPGRGCPCVSVNSRATGDNDTVIQPYAKSPGTRQSRSSCAASQIEADAAPRRVHPDHCFLLLRPARPSLNAFACSSLLTPSGTGASTGSAFLPPRRAKQ